MKETKVPSDILLRTFFGFTNNKGRRRTEIIEHVLSWQLFAQRICGTIKSHFEQLRFPLRVLQRFTRTKWSGEEEVEQDTTNNDCDKIHYQQRKQQHCTELYCSKGISQRYTSTPLSLTECFLAVAHPFLHFHYFAPVLNILSS